MYSAQVFSIFIASPSDTIEERKIFVERINYWNTINSRAKQVVLLPLTYETHTVSRVNLPPQETINKVVLKHADYVVAIFFSTLGSGGTIEEIEEAVKANKPTSLFFSNKSVPQNRLKTAEEVLMFKQEHSSKSYYHEFLEDAELIKIIDRELTAFVEERTKDQDIKEEEPVQISDLSKYSKKILTVLGKTKSYLRVQDFGGRFQIDSSNQTIFNGNDLVEYTYWKEAVSDLEGRNMLSYYKPISYGDVYSLTTLGWQVSFALEYEDFDFDSLENLL